MEWLRENIIKTLALLVSLATLVLGWQTYTAHQAQNTAQQAKEKNDAFIQQAKEKEEAAKLICKEIGEDDENIDYEILKTIDYASIKNGEFPNLSENQNRELGDLYNSLNVSAISWKIEQIDRPIAQNCLADEYLGYCEMIVAFDRKFKTTWKALNEVAFSKDFWGKDVPLACQEAEKIYAT